MTRKAYDSDLTDQEWHEIRQLLPRPKAKPGQRGRPPTDLRDVVNAIFYVLKTGCQWRLLPGDFPPWQTVYTYFRIWRDSDVFKSLNGYLRRKLRRLDGRKGQPSAGVIDSQSVKASEEAENTGYDAGKKIKGRKRHLLVDTLGLLVAVVVHSAGIQDRDGAKLVMDTTGVLTRMKLIWVDAAYAGQLEEWSKKSTAGALRS